MAVDRGMAEAALEGLSCLDDALAPHSWLLCSEMNNHPGDHRAVGTAGLLATWPRGHGRAVGELRREWGIPWRPR